MLKPGKILVALGLALSLVAGSAVAEVKEGKDYKLLLQPQPAETKGKVEVVEFFWYGCPHCYELEPVLTKWLKTLPKDVAFRRIPADFGRWTGGVKLFYALDSIGEEERVHKDLFDAIHKDRLNFNKEDEVAGWLEKKGVDRKKFTDAYNSFGVQSQAGRAQQLSHNYALDGVPTLIVSGKYLTSNSLAGSYDALPAILDELIAKVRAEQGKKK